jgi:hypothetical protein
LGQQLRAKYNEIIEWDEHSFRVSYQMQFNQDDIRMLWDASIEGSEDSTIIFYIKGKALSHFQKTEPVLCIASGERIQGRKGKYQAYRCSAGESIFPYYISPHQPFKNIQTCNGHLCNVVRQPIEFSEMF